MSNKIRDREEKMLLAKHELRNEKIELLKEINEFYSLEYSTIEGLKNKEITKVKVKEKTFIEYNPYNKRFKGYNQRVHLYLLENKEKTAFKIYSYRY